MVDPGKSYDIKVTVERGPEEYNYENLLINGYSQCESDRYDALSDGEFPPPPFYKGIEISTYFLEPCSPIDIGFPLQNWVHTPDDGPNLLITLNEFNRYDADLELIRVQYRRQKGDGAWINIREVLKSELDNDVFKIVTWNTSELKDGFYEIRAVTQCTGSQNAGISTVIVGKFEREAPQIVGVPEPSDGVLELGDEISITFNEPIRCDILLQADLFNNNNIGLYNTRTGELIDATITCNDDKIVLVPNVPQQFIENEILRVQLDSVKDLANNSFGTISWEFFVDKNPLRWIGQNIN
ncbi:MAG: Ig-like domain-containing protein, partial [Minisyncoccia bacterium]